MKKILISTLLVIAVLTNTSCADKPTAIQTAKQEQQIVIEKPVYTTKTGKRYHKSFCKYLNYSKILIEKSTAINLGLTPCKVCKP